MIRKTNLKRESNFPKGFYFFVYGTLGSKFHNPCAEAFRNHVKFIGAALTKGALLKVFWYPGLIESNDGSVHGELYYSSKYHKDLLVFLDDYEGVNRGWVKDEYVRKQITVFAKSKQYQCSAYVFQQRVKHKGLYRSFRANNKKEFVFLP